MCPIPRAIPRPTGASRAGTAWGYGWKLHLVTTVAAVWLPLAAELTPANAPDNALALRLLPEVPAKVRYVLGDQPYNDLRYGRFVPSRARW